MRNFVILISLVILFSGCRSTLQSNWRNFNAYYNTYYNAKQSYKAGLKKNLNQPRDYNPLQPIRIHKKPVNAGGQDFEKAIEKGAVILRKYHESKWVDNALGLIGKSYYFRQEYFSADQKFKELYVTTDKPEMKQHSVVWQGRVLLEMELYNEGVAFLSEQLTLFENWDKNHRAEVKALLAQHHVQLGNWQTAAEELSEGLPNLPQKEYKERGYFLLGQIYEELEDTDAAFKAYGKVSNHYVEYRVQYLSQRKTAEVARSLGRNDVAYSIFNNMVRDDKNLEYKAELDFELARTEHERGRINRAEDLYNSVLRNQLNKATAEIRAQTFYGLAEIYRFQYDDFSKAAAYYDSAAQQNVPPERLPQDFDAGELAESFGNYARLKSEIALQDSLLRLGQMTDQEFDSAMTELRKQKIAEIEQLREAQRNQQNQIVNTNQKQEQQDVTSLRNGFLNSDNPAVQQNARAQFYAIWGERPLADNWRVAALISSSAVERVESTAGGVKEGNSELMQVNIDISNVPFSEAEQDSVRKRIASYQYQLGNLFFLSLDMPDSAAYYFNKAIENPSNQNVNMVSLYSLSELYLIQENEPEAVKYAQRLVDEYPGTNYAFRVNERFNFDMVTLDNSRAIDPIQLYEQIQADDTLASAEKAERLSTFAQNFTSHKVAPMAQYDAIHWYMAAGKEDSLYIPKMEEWSRANREWDENSETLSMLKDSARAALNDTTLTLTEEQRSQYQAVMDSTLEEPDFVELYPYRGEHWDSARAAIDTFMVYFDTSGLKAKVARLEKELELPSEIEVPQEPEEEKVPELENVSLPGEYLSCEELEVELEIRGSMEQFMAVISKPDETDINEIRYLFKVNQRGIIDEYELQTEEASLDAEWIENFEENIENSLLFEPVLKDGQAVRVECTVIFPLNN